MKSPKSGGRARGEYIDESCRALVILQGRGIHNANMADDLSGASDMAIPK